METTMIPVLKTIDVWGDSILKGIVLDASCARYKTLVKNCATRVQERINVAIRNHSRFGCTIGRAQKQLQRALDAGLTSDVVLLEFGGNDCDFDWKAVSEAPEIDHQPNTPLPRFNDSLSQMIESIHAQGKEVLMMSLPPIDAQRYFRWITKAGLSAKNILHWLGDVQMIYRYQELYSTAAFKLATKFNCLFVDVRSAFLCRRDYRDLICEDGIHPNENGHRLMEQTFVEYALQML